MARVEYGAFITSLKGSIGGVSFHRNTSGQIAKIKPSQVFKQTLAQSTSQRLFSQFRASWSALSSATQILWQAFATAHTRTNYFNETKILSGYNWFLSININSNLCAGPTVPSPPAYSLPAQPASIILIISPTHLFVVFTVAYAHTTVYLFAFFTPPIRSQSLLNRSKIRLVAVTSPGTPLAYEYTSAYNAAFDFAALPAASVTGVKILASLAAISNTSYIASAFTSIVAELPPNVVASITTGFDDTVQFVLPLSNGKIICIGAFLHYNNTACNRICRLNSDLSLDATFAYGTGFDALARHVAVDSNNNIIVVGDFTTYKGDSYNHIVRINTSGTADATFVVAAGFNGNACNVAITPSNGCYVVGNFTTYKATAAIRVVLLTNVGAIDAAFTCSAGPDSTVYRVLIAASLAIYVSGAFTHHGATSYQRVMRINTNGTPDAAFASGSGFNSTCYDILLDTSDSLICVGTFTTYAGAGAPYICKLSNVAALDATFGSGTGTNDYILGISRDSNGFILIAGNFTTFDGTAIHKFARLRPSGYIDASFIGYTSSTGIGVNIALTLYNKLLVYGSITALGAIAKNRIARLYADSSTNN